MDWEKERKIQGKNERAMERKEKGKKDAVETNVVHSGLFEIKKKFYLDDWK